MAWQEQHIAAAAAGRLGCLSILHKVVAGRRQGHSGGIAEGRCVCSEERRGCGRQRPGMGCSHRNHCFTTLSTVPTTEPEEEGDQPNTTHVRPCFHVAAYGMAHESFCHAAAALFLSPVFFSRLPSRRPACRKLSEERRGEVKNVQQPTSVCTRAGACVSQTSGGKLLWGGL